MVAFYNGEAGVAGARGAHNGRISTEMKHSILVVEDDDETAELVAVSLSDLGCRVERCADGAEGLERALQGGFSVILLDLNLPSMSGLDICRKLRAKKPNLAVVMLTANDREVDLAIGFEAGADDYISKPFGLLELRARIKAVLRRIERQAAAPEPAAGGGEAYELRFDDLLIDMAKRKVLLGGEKLDLTAIEYDILVLLAEHPGRPYSREQILEAVWGYTGSTYGDNVTAHFSRLRKKIERDPNKPKYLKTVRGVGYRFCEPDEL